MPDLFRTELDEEIKCVEREITQRRRVYPKQVAGGRMRQGFADEQIALMERVLVRLKGLKP